MYTDTWQSLSKYRAPLWYKNAKFGIFIHWGVYAVPAYANEWYPRLMYQKGSEVFEHHVKTYGPHKDFGYKDFIPMFKGEKFDANEWMALVKKAGARYVMPVAEHHDGFAMYDSKLTKWNAAQMGPCRDVIGELKEAADKEGIIFSVSYHRAENSFFFNGGLDFDSDVKDPANESFYGKQQAGGDDLTNDIYAAPPTKEHCEDWLARLIELVEKYRPQILWFDWWIQNTGWKPYLKKFAAYYYNRAAEWGIEVAINYKHRAYAYGTAVYDVERGQLAGIDPNFWQTDTAVARNSWGYTENNDFKSPEELVRDLIDVVSKNGCFLLNIGPKADGSITEEDRSVLLSIGKWLEANGEGIYDTSYWERFGEGPNNIKAGHFTDSEAMVYTSEDIRFTYKDGIVYAFVMKFPEDGVVTVKSLARRNSTDFGGDVDITNVSVLGFDSPLELSRDAEALHIKVKDGIETTYPVCFRIEID